ncbi:hypothetical protein V3W47_10570 [Deinococcus sp. YIM 134068]|uniref:hypothetical protein n=1 Tax=Deinococcus lichenicola TaxID=3118910 RepID=UPI002F947B9F
MLSLFFRLNGWRLNGAGRGGATLPGDAQSEGSGVLAFSGHGEAGVCASGATICGLEVRSLGGVMERP